MKLINSKYCLRIFRAAIVSLPCLFVAISCGSGQEAKVEARFVPERYDDFAFENNLIAGRVYGKALENCGNGQLTSPGIDIWVKIPGVLVVNSFYKGETEDGRTYHKNWGYGKDCYKVGQTLGAGGSVPLVGGQLAFPTTNFRSYKVLEDTPEKAVFCLEYPAWEKDGVKVSLTKKFTVTPDTYFVKVEDSYDFNCDSLVVVCGVNRHIAQNILYGEKLSCDRYILWEGASDQTHEEDNDSRIGVAVIVPGAAISSFTEDGSHAIVGKTIVPGETFTYWFGSCWNGGDIKTEQDWAALVSAQE